MKEADMRPIAEGYAKIAAKRLRSVAAALEGRKFEFVSGSDLSSAKEAVDLLTRADELFGLATMGGGE